ncbi:hypothetical protein EJB05_28757, partial [Eragrostis curvula]
MCFNLGKESYFIYEAPVGNPKVTWKQVRHKPTSYLKLRMIGCLVNSWTDLMESRLRRWIKAKDMLDSSKCWLG